MFHTSKGRDSVGGTETRYGLDGSGIESRGGRDFPYPSITALVHKQPLIQWVTTLFSGGKVAGVKVVQLVEALRYKSEGRGFDSRWYHWNFSLT